MKHKSLLCKITFYSILDIINNFQRKKIWLWDPFQMWIQYSCVDVSESFFSYPGKCLYIYQTIRNCHLKLMSSGSVVDDHRSKHPSTSKLEENMQKVKFQHCTSIISLFKRKQVLLKLTNT